MPVLVSAAGALCSLRASRWKCGPCFSCQGCAVAVDVRPMHSSLTAASSRERGGRTCRGAWRGRAMSVPEHPKHKCEVGGGEYGGRAPRNINNSSTDSNNNSNGQQQQFSECSPPKWKQYLRKEELSVATLPFHTRGLPHSCAILGQRTVWGKETTQILRSLV